MNKKIAIVGDFNPDYESHTKLNDSIEHVKNRFNLKLDYEWIDTIKAEKEADGLLCQYSGIWSAPGSPFKSLDGALKAIHYARINNVPHLGTCAGFQHSIVEFARNVLNIKDAQHQEYDNDSDVLFISKLDCSLAGKRLEVKLKENSMAYACYGKNNTTENYYCNFGINPKFKAQLNHPILSISGTDQDGEIRIIEYPENRFFVATLFVPQTNSSASSPHPIIERFIKECDK